MSLLLAKNHKVSRANYRAVQDALEKLGAVDSEARGIKRGVKFDAGETMVFTRMLEHVQADVVEQDFPELQYRNLIPLDGSVNAGADTFKWRREFISGKARWGANGADDAPLVTATFKEEYTAIKEIVIAHQYTVTELLGAQMAGVQLSSRLAVDAREAVERFADRVAALGDDTRGIGGLLKGVDKYGVDLQTQSGDGYTGSFNDSGATGATMLADLHKFAMSLWINSKQTASAKRLIIDTASYARIATTPTSDTHPDKTVLQSFLESSPTVKEVVPWIWADGADADNDGPRWVAYDPSLSVLRLIFPVEYRALPPQAVNYMIKIPGFARFGGVVIEKPLGVAYLDGMRD